MFYTYGCMLVNWKVINILMRNLCYKLRLACGSDVKEW